MDEQVYWCVKLTGTEVQPLWVPFTCARKRRNSIKSFSHVGDEAKAKVSYSRARKRGLARCVKVTIQEVE